MYRDAKAIKREILSKFRSVVAKDQHRLPPLWLQIYMSDSLNRVERRYFDKAIKDLIGKGIVEPIDGKWPNLELTVKGFNLIQR